MFQIDLTASGELLLYLPCGRSVEINATAEGIDYIKKICLDHRRGLRNQPGYIGTLPTQHAVDKFLREKKVRVAREQAEELKGKAKKLDIDWDRLEINL
jgi:hypothetical protein